MNAMMPSYPCMAMYTSVKTWVYGYGLGHGHLGMRPEHCIYTFLVLNTLFQTNIPNTIDSRVEGHSSTIYANTMS